MKLCMPMSRGMTVTILTGALLMTTLAQTGPTPQLGSTTKKSFGKTPGGQQVDLYVLTNKNGAEVSITNYGATDVPLKHPGGEPEPPPTHPPANRQHSHNHHK